MIRIRTTWAGLSAGSDQAGGAAPAKALKTVLVLSLMGWLFGTAGAAVEKKISPDNPLAPYIKLVEADVFNDAARGGPGPRPGGSIVIRAPSDHRTLNLLTENAAPTQEYLALLFDSLISRDSETLEWLPWIARRWEIRDLVTLKSGEVIEGRIRSETEREVVIQPGAGKLTVGKTDLASWDAATSQAVTKDGQRLRGVINDIVFTIEIERDSGAPLRTIARSDVAEKEVSTAGQITKRPAILRNVVFLFYLRDDVRWHDGQPVTAADVRFTVELIQNESVDAGHLRNYYRDLEKIEVLDGNVVKFTWARPYFQALDFSGGIQPLPRHIFNPDKFQGDPEGLADHFHKHPFHSASGGPVGCGPFKFGGWEPGKQISVVKNTEYWARRAGLPYWQPEQPYLDRITWSLVQEKLPALLELQKGNLDVDMDVEPDVWVMPQTNTPEFTSRFVRAHNLVPLYTYIGWNQRRPQFADKRVRRAMTHLIPREDILRDIHKGLGFITTGPFFINSPMYDKTIEPIAYDPRAARRLLREAGWADHDGDGVLDKDGVRFEFEYLIHGAREYHGKIADIIKENVERAGIRMNIRKLDWTILGKTVTDHNFDAVRLAWQASVDGDPFQIWHSSQAQDKGSNYVGFRNAEADRIMEEAREEFDPLKRWAMYRKLHRIIHEEQPYTFLFCFESLYFYNKRIRGVKLYPTGRGYDLTEWYVVDEAN
ncbi:MAG: hypothetical protein Kow0059_19060 [Candidatus Sumerlaeia bacterium]